MNKVWICFRQQFNRRKLVAIVSLVAEPNKRYARKHKTDTDCMFMSCHVGVSEWIHTPWFPECQGTPCSKQARNLKFRWLQLDSNPEPLKFVNEHSTIWPIWLEWLSATLQTYWFWVRVQLQSLINLIH